MRPKDSGPLTGKTLGTAARRTGFRAQGWRVFVLQSLDDRDGRLAGEDYELQRILGRLPELKKARIRSDEDYFGTRILRVRPPAGAEEAEDG